MNLFNLTDTAFIDTILSNPEFKKKNDKGNRMYSTANIEDEPRDKPNYRSVNNRKVWSRNPRYASEVVTDADYLCEIDIQHKHFISKFNDKNYVEAHHLIPIQYQEQFVA